MASREEVVGQLQELIDYSDILATLRHEDSEWALWIDEANSYVRRTLGAAAGKELAKITGIRALTFGDAQPIYLDLLREAVTMLRVFKARIERGEYDSELAGEASRAVVAGRSRPSVFIAHSGEPPVLFRLTRFLEALEVKPIIAEWLPFKGRQVPDQARAAMDGCEAAIVFATAADAVAERKQPGRGALTETGILQERFGDKIIYLVEEGVELGPMLDSFAHESFTQECLESAFYRVVVELKEYGII